MVVIPVLVMIWIGISRHDRSAKRLSGDDIAPCGNMPRPHLAIAIVGHLDRRTMAALDYLKLA